MSLDRTWLTLGQAADAAGRSRRTIERWISDERLPTLVVLGRTRVNELQLLQVERDTRRAARRGRPGPRTPDNLTMGVVSSTQSRGTTPEDA